MARKSVTKSKPVTKIRKYQTAGLFSSNANSIYQQVANPYYVSGTYTQEARLEAQKALEEAARFGDYSQTQKIQAEVRRKEEEAAQQKAVNEANQQIAAQNQQEVQQAATDALSSGVDLTKTYLKQRSAQKTAEAITNAANATWANAAMQAGTGIAWAPTAAAPTAASVGLNTMPTLATSATGTNFLTAAVPTGAVEVGSQVGQVAAAGTTAGTTAGTAAGIGAGAGASAGGTAANTAANVAGTGTSIGTGLATAGVGLGLNIGGTLLEKSGDDNDFRTFTAKEKNRNLAGSAMKSAGTGVGIGATIGSFVPIPGVGTVVGGLIGGLVGGGIGLIKGAKENKESKRIADEYKQEQERIERERAEYERKRKEAIRQQGRLIANSANRGFIGSRLQGLNTGFGYNTSTNMNTQPTSSFYGKTGGKLPGGHVVPIGDDAVKFIGRKHSEGGIKLDPRTEVEGGETMDKVMMNGGKPNDYFFSAYLKLGGKSFAKRHEELVKSGAGQAEIQQLAKMQESVANKKGEKDRGPEQIAMYGGIHKYQTGDFKETADAVKDSDGIYRVKDAQGNILAESSDKNVAEKKAQNAAMAAADPDPADDVVVVEEEQGVPAGQVVYKKGRKYITPGYINTINGIRGRKEELEGLEDGIYKQRYFTKTAEADGASPFSRYEEGEIERRAQINGYNPYLEGTPGYIRVQKVLDERNRVNAEAAKSAKTYEDLSGTKPPVTAEQSANAQSNANASNVTVRDQNQANAQAPSAQTSVAPGGTTNSAGQAAADASAKSGTQGGTPVTPTKERLFGKDDATKGGKGVSKSMEKVPEGQGDQGIYFGNVSNAQFDAFKANNPWFDFSAGFDPKKRDYVAADGVRGSSDVARFQEEYNKHVGQGNKLRVDGKLGEQTATAMLMFTDPDAPVAPAEDKSKKEEPGPTKTTTPEDFNEIANLKRGVNGSLLAGLGQLIPVGYALARPYKTEGNLPRMKSPGKVGAGSVRGAILPRVNMNAERAAAERNTVAIKNAIQNTNAGPGGIAAMMAANTAQGNQMLAIANQEQEANKQLAAEEARMGQQASQFNIETGLRAGMANMQSQLAVDQANLEAGIKEAALKIDEKRYKREEILGALDTAASRIAGIVKDEKSYKAQERLAKAIDGTGSYDRFTIYEQLKKESKKKKSPYYGRTDAELRKIASNTYNEFAGKQGGEADEEKKLGGRRKYTSRLGELSRNKKSFNI